uniref:Uncharacterized protein n=1 Tax=Salmonella sp. TaxID=599 RepID=A0A482ETK1_SALSP|nr:hypothetical protein [Salmonella sp.]QBM91450.1 hypothetical protein NNIBIDOC_00121 [Salmonella sp.]
MKMANHASTVTGSLLPEMFEKSRQRRYRSAHEHDPSSNWRTVIMTRTIRVYPATRKKRIEENSQQAVFNAVEMGRLDWRPLNTVMRRRKNKIKDQAAVPVQRRSRISVL